MKEIVPIDVIIVESHIDYPTKEKDEELNKRVEEFKREYPRCLINYPDGTYACGIKLPAKPRKIESVIKAMKECNKCEELSIEKNQAKKFGNKLKEEIKFIDYFCMSSTRSSLQATNEVDKLYCNQMGQMQSVIVCKRKNCIQLRKKELRYKIRDLINFSKIVQSL